MSINGKLARRAPGMVLIFTAGVLAILAAMGTAFYAISQSGTTAAVRYSDMVRADLLARGGMAYAVANLRDQAFRKSEDPSDPWYMVNYYKGLEGRISYAKDDPLNAGKKLPYTQALTNSVGDVSDRFTVEVSDAASKINVNACDNLAVILDNLCRLIGPPLKPADLTMIQPYRWYVESNNSLADYAANSGDTMTALDWYYALAPNGRPVQAADGTAIYGDGYAIAGFRSRNGLFSSLEQVKQALTFVDRNGNGILDDALELLEIESKYAALKPYLTVDSWVDTTTVSVGKFEWVTPYGTTPVVVVMSNIRDVVTGAVESNVPCQVLIDRDKSWVADDPVGDPQNLRGSLRGSYVAIINGHGAGQLRRIATNGTDWIALRGYSGSADESMTVPPGPISSYMIIAREDARLFRPNDGTGSPLTDGNGNPLYLPETDASNGLDDDGDGIVDNENGQFVDDPDIDYERHPLCIHRAPVNINTASDKVLAALLLNLNVSHGSFMSVGTDADITQLAGGKSRWLWNGNVDPDWKINDYDDPTKNPYRTVEPYILTPKGLKRIPGSKGQPAYDVDWDALIKPNLPAGYSMDYIGNNGTTDPAGTTKINEAQELAFRIVIARQPDAAFPYIDPATGVPVATGSAVYERQPFRSWDDLYFRVVRPWDDSRINPLNSSGLPNPRYNDKRGSVARLIMANFNANMDILKFNPGIEWIDRFGRNFTELEPVMVYTNQGEAQLGASWGHGQIDSSQAKPQDIKTCDQDGAMNNNAIPVFTRERSSAWPIFTSGVFGTDPVMNGTYVIRSYRYKADEMIDKTDLNRSSTEFVFDSNGIFQITSTGQIIHPITGQLLAERKLESLVKVYEVWRETTQRQFVNGYIMRAAGNTGTRCAGSIGRDATNVNSRLALTTLPEPLVPLRYRFADASKIKEVVDTTLTNANRKRDAWGNVVVDMARPDVLSNYVQPAGYDGQIVLATNTLAYDSSAAGDADSFLASFNGDVDTDTCRGIGREQAKTPLDCKVRVLDTGSLLGVLNDRHIDTDPGLKGDAASDTAVVKDCMPVTAISDATAMSARPILIWRYNVALNCLRGLDTDYYWNNVTCRQGDLRAEGVWVGGPGVAGNEGVFKYLCGDDSSGYSTDLNLTFNGTGASHVSGESGQGDSGDVKGFLLTMWAKTAWHHNDGRNHEFFDVSTPGWNDNGVRAEAFYFRKQGRVQWAVSENRTGGSGPIQITDSSHDMVPGEDWTWGISGSGNRTEDLSLCLEPIQNAGDWSEPDWPIYLHGGVSGVPAVRMPKGEAPHSVTDCTDPSCPWHPSPGPESPAYRIQPFRWQYLGARIFLKRDFASCNNNFSPGATNHSVPSDWNEGKSGFWKRSAVGGNPWWKDPNAVWVATNLFRPFIDSERWPDSPGGTDYQPWGKYWCVVQPQGSVGFTPYQDKGRAGDLAGRGDGGQHVRWRWASPGGTSTNNVGGKSDIQDFTVFGVNNCNPGYNYKNCGSFCSIYRNAPDEGTYAVIDEYKLSLKETTLRNPPDWDEDRATRNDASRPGEMTLSRYYTPVDPTNPAECPTFTSQTLLQSKRGFNRKTAPVPEYITLARVSWNVFTPRFMVEYKEVGTFTRNEIVTEDGGYDLWNVQTGWSWFNAPTTKSIAFRGPFDYRKYNNIVVARTGEYFEEFDDPTYDNNVNIYPYRCLRPTAAQYHALNKQVHASRGVEVELLEDVDTDPANGNEVIKAGPFKDPAPYVATTDTVSGSQPNKINAIGTALNPVKVRVDRLRYRVRFRYYIDPLADSPRRLLGHDEMDAGGQYVLDTPVFDDISVTYFDKIKILDYREVTE